MKLDNLKTIEELKAFLTGTQPVAFAVATTKDERYLFVENILKRFCYRLLKRAEKGAVIAFLRKINQRLVALEKQDLYPFHGSAQPRAN